MIVGTLLRWGKMTMVLERVLPTTPIPVYPPEQIMP